MEQNLKDNVNRYLSLKSEKLASAVYAITDFLSDSEPLKWRLRDKSLMLVSDSVALRDFSIGNYDKIIFVVNELIALLEVGGVGGSVSRMNFDILKNEYLSLNQLVQKKSADSHSLNNLKIDEQVLNDPDLKANNNSYERLSSKTGESSVLPEAASQSRLNKYLGDRPADTYKGQKDTIKDNVQNVIKTDRSSSKKESRQDQIVLFIKDKGWMSINEIAAAISGCSLKTVQRELSALVERGILHKHGERRWSKYILVA